MVAGRPFYHAYPADFLMATQGWDLETKGAYRLIIDVLNDRDRPIPDEPKFIAGILGCSIQKWRKLREFLIDQGKLMLTEDGMHLTNPRFEREHMGRAEQRLANQLNGHLGALEKARRAGQTDLDFDPSPARTRASRARHTRTDGDKNDNKVQTKLGKSSNKVASRSKLPDPDPPENNDLAQAPPLAPCARDSSETIDKDSSLPISDSAPAQGRLAQPDLKTLYDLVCEAAGFNPVQPAAIDRAMTHVERWRDLGADFDRIVLPSIRSIVLASDEPTRTLGRFDVRIAHELARSKAAAKTDKPYSPPAIPVLNPDGEDEMFFPLRTDLLETAGDRPYCVVFNGIRFEDAGPCQGEKRPLRIRGPDHLLEPIRHGRWRSILLAAARQYGFTEVW